MAVNNLNIPGVGIQPSLIDAKGDLLVGTANDAVGILGVTGPTGSVLVTDAGETTGLKWVDPGTVGGLVHIQTTAVSASASELFSTAFSSNYDNYLLLFSLHGDANRSISIRLTASGVDASTNYSEAIVGWRSNNLTTLGVVNNDDTATQTFVGEVNSGSTYRSAFSIQVFNPFLTTVTSIITDVTYVRNAAGYASRYVGANSHKTANSYDGFRVFTGAGTMTGTISIYGYRK